MRDELQHEIGRAAWTRPTRYVPKQKPKPMPPVPPSHAVWMVIDVAAIKLWIVVEPVAMVAPGYFAQLLGFWGELAEFLVFLVVWVGLGPAQGGALIALSRGRGNQPFAERHR